MKILAIIPARGGSKRVPSKNIKLLAGKPLVAWTIETALKSNLFDRIIVSTENKKIAEIAKKFNAEIPFYRPKTLASDTASGWSVLQHALKELKKKKYIPDLIVYLSPASPFRQVKDIKNGIKKLIDKKANVMLSVCKSERNPYFNMVEIKKGKICLVKKPVKKITQSQKAPRVYSLNDSVYIFREQALRKNSSLLSNKKTDIFLMPKERSIDIDEKFDFEIAEYLIGKTYLR